MEIWDLYHRDGTPAGIDLVRGERIPDGLYHIVCDIILRHADGDFLLTRRALDRPIQPGRWELSAGGSAIKGETPLDCARRELREETGIDGEDFREFAVCVRDDNHCIYHSFTAFTAAPKDSVRLQAGETIACRWLGPEALEAFLRSGEALERQTQRYAAYLKGELGLSYDL